MKKVICSSLIVLFIVGAANAATVPFGDPLTGYTGENADGSPNPLGSTENAATVAQLAANGLEPAIIWGGGDGIPDPGAYGSWEEVLFDTTGATFGAGQASDPGRNIIRTIESDYKTTSFDAYITAVGLAPGQNVFLGLGQGHVGTWGVPEIDVDGVGNGTDGTFVEAMVDGFSTWVTNDGDFGGWDNIIGGDSPGEGTHRFKLSYDAGTSAVVFSYDANYDGTFVADFTHAAVDVSGLFTDGEASKVYFEGDDGVLLKDFQIVPEPTTMALLGLGVLGLIRRRR